MQNIKHMSLCTVHLHHKNVTLNLRQVPPSPQRKGEIWVTKLSGTFAEMKNSTSFNGIIYA
jgi:hypothetical protein